MKKTILVIGLMLVIVSLLSGCFEDMEYPDFKNHILSGYLEDWYFYNDTNVGGYILIISNATFEDGFKSDIKEHWFSRIKYSGLDMQKFVGNNVSIYYHSNYYDGWNEKYSWDTQIIEIKNLEQR